MTEQQNTRPSASREIAVKPLVWVKDPKNVSFVDAEYVDTFGLYCIAESVLFIGHTETGIPFDTVKEAKAAAQADYERRILSAIDTTPGNTDPAKCDSGWRGMDDPALEQIKAARVLLANTPNPIFDDLKGVMMGEFYWTREISDENGDEATEKLYVPWTTIKEIILAALRSLAQEGE